MTSVLRLSHYKKYELVVEGALSNLRQCGHPVVAVAGPGGAGFRWPQREVRPGRAEELAENSEWRSAGAGF